MDPLFPPDDPEQEATDANPVPLSPTHHRAADRHFAAEEGDRGAILDVKSGRAQGTYLAPSDREDCTGDKPGCFTTDAQRLPEAR